MRHFCSREVSPMMWRMNYIQCHYLVSPLVKWKMHAGGCSDLHQKTYDMWYKIILNITDIYDKGTAVNHCINVPFCWLNSVFNVINFTFAPCKLRAKLTFKAALARLHDCYFFFQSAFKEINTLESGKPKLLSVRQNLELFHTHTNIRHKDCLNLGFSKRQLCFLAAITVVEQDEFVSLYNCY